MGETHTARSCRGWDYPRRAGLIFPGSSLSLITYILRRWYGDRRLLVGAFVGVLVAALVVAAAPMYLRSLEKAAVSDAIDSMGLYNPNIQTTTHWLSLSRSEFETADLAVNRVTDQIVGGLVHAQVTIAKSSIFNWAKAGQQIRTGSLASEISFASMSNLDAHVQYVEGRPPGRGIEYTYPDGAPLIEVALPASRARNLGLSVGEVIESFPVATKSGMLRARLVGVFEPYDEREEFWLGSYVALLLPDPPRQDQELGGVFVTSQEPLLDGVSETTAGLSGTYWWWFYTRKNQLKEMSASELVGVMQTLTERTEKVTTQPLVISGIEPTMTALQQKLLYARIPMFLLAALAVAVVAYYLLLVSGLLIRKRVPDTVMLRSRGMSVLQVGRLYILEGAALVGLPILLAPLISAVLVSQLGRLQVYTPITNGGALPVELTWKSWAWAAAAGIASFLVLLVPALVSARRRISEQREAEARPDRPPFFQRYFLDVVVLILGGLVWWELRSKGTIATTGAEGQATFDLTLLFAPAMFLVAVALIFLRLFPLLAKVAAWVASRTQPAWVAVGFWRLSRSPYWYGWPVLLLVFAAGLAVVSSTVASTLQRSNEEQINYSAVSEFHVAPGGNNPNVDTGFARYMSGIDGVQAVSRAFRTGGSFGTTTQGQSFTLLAVEGKNFANVAWFRDDFSERPLNELLPLLEIPVKPDPLYLPPGATELGAFVRTEPFVQDLFVWAIVRDATGRSTTMTLGPAIDSWQYQSSPVPASLTEPVELLSLQTFQQVGPDGGRPVTMYIDDLQAITTGADGQPHVQVFFDFEDASQWTALPTSEGADTVFNLAGETPDTGSKPGRAVGRISMGRGTDNGIRGIYRTATGQPIPVLANSLFLALTGTKEAQPFSVQIGGAFANVVIIDTTKYFPTLDPGTQPFLIAEVDTLLSFLKLRGRVEYGPNEVFIKSDPSRHDEVMAAIQLGARVSQITDRQGLLQSSLIDPLAVAGWRGIGVIALALTALAATLGYVTYLSAHHTRTQTDAAYMRSLGLSRGGYLGLVVIEHAIVGALGIGLGIASGLVVSGLAVSSLAHTETGRVLIPPYLLQTDWQPVAAVLSAVGIAAVASVAVILRAFSRAEIHELVRVRE